MEFKLGNTYAEYIQVVKRSCLAASEVTWEPNNNWCCSLEEGHDGPHVAMFPDGYVCGVERQETQPETPSEANQDGFLVVDVYETKGRLPGAQWQITNEAGYQEGKRVGIWARHRKAVIISEEELIRPYGA